MWLLSGIMLDKCPEQKFKKALITTPAYNINKIQYKPKREHAWRLCAVARLLKQESTSPSFGSLFFNSSTCWRMSLKQCCLKQTNGKQRPET